MRVGTNAPGPLRAITHGFRLDDDLCLSQVAAGGLPGGMLAANAQTIGRLLDAYGLDILRPHRAAGEADVPRPA